MFFNSTRGKVIFPIVKEIKILVKKILKMTAIIIIIVIAIVISGLTLFFNFAPQIGADAQGERLEKMFDASNFSSGKFHNTVPTDMSFNSSKMAGTMWEFFKGNKNREPAGTIEVPVFNKVEFEKLGFENVYFTWFGHSSLLVKIDGKTILIDPVFSNRASMFSFMGPERFPYSSDMDVGRLPEIDAVIISHDHYDHLDYKTILQLKDNVQHFFVPLSVGAHLEKWGVPSDNIIELNWWETIDFENIQLVFTPSRHFSGRGLTNRFSTLWGSWIIIGKQQRLFFGGDSGYFEGFKEIGEKYGPFDLTFLECGAYNENWANIHMMPEETVQAHIDLKGKYLMPIHWGKFDLSVHPWKEPIQRATKEGENLDVRFLTPEIGVITELNENPETSRWWKEYQ